MRIQVSNRVRMLHRTITAEAEASAPDRRKWLLIHPLPNSTSVNLVEFEVKASVDPDDYLGPDEILDRKVEHFDDLESAVDALKARGVDTNKFDAPWKMDYPL